MKIIGIHDGHNSSVAYMDNGEIIFAIQEERITGIKNEEGFPINACKFVLDKYNLNSNNIDEIAISTIERDPLLLEIKRHRVFTVLDHIKECNDYWKPRLSGKDYNINYHLDLKNNDPRFNHKGDIYKYPNYLYELPKKEQVQEFKKIRKQCVAEFFGVSENTVNLYDHHECHIYYGYYTNSKRTNDEMIGFTIDAYGDRRNQAVWQISNNNFKLLADSNQCELARMYRTITLYLGMKPLEHEFKVMGMAPYCKEKHANEVFEILKPLLKVDGLKVLHNNTPRDLYQFCRENLEGYRFDSIAGGIQKWLEYFVIKLVKNIYSETNCRKFVFSGGVAMNVKLNMVLTNLEFVDDFYVCGSSSDESLSIGACYRSKIDNHKNKPLDNLYLGNSHTDQDIHEYFNNYCNKDNYFITNDISSKDIATLLSKGEVIARLGGRMEFGSRALGNRSILANPSKPDIIKEINEMIKGRDFWMPFALTVLEDFEDDYLLNPKNICSKFMATCFDTIPQKLAEIKAGTHPYDSTVRPQVLKYSDNPLYFNIIKEFHNITGIGAILNTSFNIHGLPIVNSIEQAFYVLENSGLKYLLLENNLVTKK